MSDTSAARRQFFGCDLSPVRFEEWLQALNDYIAGDEKRIIVAHHNLHSLYVLRHSDKVKMFYERCRSCYIDGLPVCWINTIAGAPTLSARRFSLMDKFPDLLRYAQEHNWRIFYLGSSEEVVAISGKRFRHEFPALDFQFCGGYFEDSPAIVEKVNNFQPDLLLVGMGMPRQEQWILENIAQLEVSVVMQSGGTLDFYGGEQAKPPVWVSKIGLAWLYRLVSNPKRLGRRYLIEPWTLILPSLRLALRKD
jgi:N-acetylglucosaminyldiphosphoundecaprenol N-acetyl-beta-D-mannosaminyltransferase